MRERKKKEKERKKKERKKEERKKRVRKKEEKGMKDLPNGHHSKGNIPGSCFIGTPNMVHFVCFG